MADTGYEMPLENNEGPPTDYQRLQIEKLEKEKEILLDALRSALDHNLLGYLATSKCDCDPSVGNTPCMACAAFCIKKRIENAIALVEGK
jgi:hypothetical protein